MRRCLQTARLVLDTRQMEKKGIKLKVMGNLRDSLGSQSNFPACIKKSMTEFYEFDFSDILKSVEKYAEFFFLDFLENKETKKYLITSLENHLFTPNRADNAGLFLKLLKGKIKNREKFEYFHDLFVRAQKFKTFMRSFIEINKVKDGELILITHSNFLKSWTAKDIDVYENKLIDFYHPKNCEFFKYELK